jgi:TolB-like protein/predicted Zn-dependent protease
MDDSQKRKSRLEIGHVLFIDIAGYSKLTTEEESEALPELNRIVRDTEAVREAEAARQLIFLPTGDGIALVFTGSIEEPVECALQLSQALRAQPNLPVRMGIHSGPVHSVADVNQRDNIAGSGINVAQRVMDCGDAGHILVSKRVAEDLGQYRRWQPYLHDLGDFEVKHGVVLSVVNLYADGVGNPALPGKLKQSTRGLSRARSKRSPILVGLLAVLLFTFAVLALVFAPAILKQLGKRNTADRGQPPAAAGSLPIREKSIAVLPFENLSEDKGSAYFVAGMQDEILTALAKIRELKVISKTSTAKYRSRPDNLKAIAQELGVAAILEGSVQKLGDAVHITVQLIDGRNDAHLWADSYDRELKNVFGMEREVAETVASKLKAELSPQDATELSRVPTTNAQAYDRYLKGEYAKNEFKAARANSIKPAIDFYKEAVALDPRFALAYTKLADAELRAYYVYTEERSPQTRDDGRAHLAKALELDPDLIEAHLLRADLYWYVDHDPARALAEVEPLLSRAPNDPRILRVMSDAKGEMGDWQGQLDAIKRAIELDPRNREYLATLAGAYGGLRRYAEAIATAIRIRALEPKDWVTRLNLVGMLMWSDKLTEAEAELQQWPDAKLQSLIRASKYALLQQIEVWNRNYDAALALTPKIPDIPNRLPTQVIPVGNIQKNTDLGFIHLYRGDKASAEQAFTAARNELELLRTSNADNADFYRDESLIAAGLGQHTEAVEAARKACNLSHEDNFPFNLAQIYAHFGDANLAFATIRKLIDKPNGGGLLCAAELRRNPIWDPIRKDPRFEKAIITLAAKESN